MARALRAWALNRGGKNSVRNLRYGPRTQLVRGIYLIIYLLSLSVILNRLLVITNNLLFHFTASGYNNHFLHALNRISAFLKTITLSYTLGS